MQEPVRFPLSPNDYIHVLIGIKNVRLGCWNAWVGYVLLNLSADIYTPQKENLEDLQ